MRTIASVLITGCPPQQGIFPHIRIGRKWINTLWLVPIGTAALLCMIALAQSLSEIPDLRPLSIAIQDRFWLPLVAAAPALFEHVLHALHNAVGLQILADHPRLYWGRDCTPGTDWFRFQVPVPKDRIWTAKDDSVTLPTGSAFPVCAIHSACRAGGISRSTSCG